MMKTTMSATIMMMMALLELIDIKNLINSKFSDFLLEVTVAATGRPVLTLQVFFRCH